MKVFTFDPATGRRGSAPLGDVRCAGYSNRHRLSPVLPRPTQDTNWVAASAASDTRNQPITAAQFGQPAICFCIGQITCGTDTAWEWVALIDPPAA